MFFTSYTVHVVLVLLLCASLWSPPLAGNTGEVVLRVRATDHFFTPAPRAPRAVRSAVPIGGCLFIALASMIRTAVHTVVACSAIYRGNDDSL